MDITENRYIDILNKVIDYRVFDSSASSLARRLGFKGRMAFKRLTEGTLKESTAQNYILQIEEHFKITTDDIIKIVGIIDVGKKFYKYIKEEELRPDEILISFVKRDFHNFSDDFHTEIEPLASDIYRDDPHLYFGMVMFVYTRLVNFDPYLYNKDTYYKKIKKLYTDICNILSTNIPENHTARLASLAYLSDDLVRFTYQNYLGILQHSIYILWYYADPDYVNTALEMGVLYNEWGEMSYWHEEGRPYCPGEKVIILFARESYSVFHGMYMGQIITVGKDTESFEPGMVFSILLLEKENVSDTEALFQINNVVGSTDEKLLLRYGWYSYSENDMTITLRWENEEDNFIGLPNRLSFIDIYRSYPNNNTIPKEEKIWSNVIRKLDSNGCVNMFSSSLLDCLKTEYLDEEYEVVDVIISRNFFSLEIKINNGDCSSNSDIASGDNIIYRIPIKAYSFLRNCTVFQDVSIKRHTVNGELYVEWAWLGYQIPLAEFELVIR